MSEIIEAPSQPEAKSSSSGFIRITIIATAGFVGVIILIFVIALVIALSDVERAGQIIKLVRDLFFITLTLESILIFFAFAVLIVQIAWSVNLLQTRTKPILENTQDALESAKGSIEFASKNTFQPLIRLLSFFSGLGVFFRELGGLRRVLRRERPKE